MKKIDFYYNMLIESEKSYKFKNFMIYLTRAKNELMMDEYILSDISDFFVKLDATLIDNEYRILAGVCFFTNHLQKSAYK